MDETDIKLINIFLKYVEIVSVNCCLMSEEEQEIISDKEYMKKLRNSIQNVLKELQLAKEALKDKCEIADERNQLLIQNKKKDKIIDEMAKWLYEDDTWFGYGKFKEINTSEKIKQFFLKKVDEQE